MPKRTFRHFELLSLIIEKPQGRPYLCGRIGCTEFDLTNSIAKLRRSGIKLICRRGVVTLHPQSQPRARSIVEAFKASSTAPKPCQT
jgi:hypothetical protein